jgi:hypothetical protein
MVPEHLVFTFSQQTVKHLQKYWSFGQEVTNQKAKKGAPSTWWRSWLRHCTTSLKVAGSIPDGVIGIFY